MKRNTEDFMSLWRSPKPTIAKVHGYAVAGGSDIALCCDLLVMADDARIGYMPTRVWGCPTTAMWTYRLGPTRAKQMMFTGDTIDGRTAADWGLANRRCPPPSSTPRRCSWPRASPACRAATWRCTSWSSTRCMLTMGLEQTQMLATMFDGITRHNPEGMWFRRYAQAEGFKAAVQWRDSGRRDPGRRRGARADRGAGAQAGLASLADVSSTRDSVVAQVESGKQYLVEAELRQVAHRRWYSRPIRWSHSCCTDARMEVAALRSMTLPFGSKPR